jgi:RecG-like helicase
MAPTEILARQHLATIAPLAEAAGLRIAILTGRERGAARKEILDRLVLGDIDLLLGTHSLFQEDVAFHDLALAVVDEQHRFGVHQRLALTQKGEAVDVLVLTATPIPRTLVLTFSATWTFPSCARNHRGANQSTPGQSLCRVFRRLRTRSVA